MSMKPSLVTLVVIVLVVISATAVIWTSVSMKGEISRRVGSSLVTVLGTTHEALRMWREQTLTNASISAASAEVRSAVERQLRLPRRYSNLVHSDALSRLRSVLRPYVQKHGYSDFAVIAPDGMQIASGLDDFLGQDVIAKLNPVSLHSVFGGSAKLGVPFRLPADSAASPLQINLIAGVPIVNESNQVIAALVFRIDPDKEFSDITRLGRLGRTGETYVFDKYARLLTPSRFHEDLLHAGLVGPDGTAVFRELRDPGVNLVEGLHPAVPPEKQPLTRMAAAAIRGEAGADLDGYRDYRGVPVVGAWLWDEDLGLGLATEMDVSEANAPMATIWNLSVIMLGIVFSAVVLLLRAVAHRARLQTINFGYEQALKARQDVLAVIAHDLRNPINSIALSSSVLAKMVETPSTDTSFIVRNLDVIHRSAFRMNRLIEDLLVSTGIEAGMLRIRRQECDLRALLSEFEENFSPLAAEKSIEFTCSIAPDIRSAFIDPDRLIQVLSNLLGNAIKYTPNGGTVTLSVKMAGVQIEFRVKDSGPGISSSELPRIFDQYWQAKHAEPGSGLGLFISKNLVEAHGGKIWVESAIGNGTTVCFTIPLFHDKKNPQDPAALRNSGNDALAHGV
jgi:signal transduction histidine kinase